MIVMPQSKTRNRDTKFSFSSKSVATSPLFMKPSAITLLLCLLHWISNLPDLAVTGFVTTARTVRSGTGRGVISISHDVTVADTPPSSPSPSLLSVHTNILGKAEENTKILADSRLDFSLSTTALLAVQSSENENENPDTMVKNSIGTNKRNFFASLDSMETLNGATKERSALLAKMIAEKKVISVGEKSKNEFASSSSSSSSSSIVPTTSYENPGSSETFLTSGAAVPIAEGKWKVVYAPHMTTAMDIFRGRFDVTYDLFSDSSIVSHAYYDFPIVGKGYLSVSGTFGSVANDSTKTYSRVDFDRAWIKALPSSSSMASVAPYDSLEAVPDSLLKMIINEIGKRAFIESVAVFPVSFLDDDTVVFEFEFLGTKICAHKV